MSEEGNGDDVAELDRALREARERSARLRRVQTCATLTLVGVFAVAITSFVRTGREMYAPERFESALGPQVAMLRPQLESTVRQVAEHVGPHYARLGQERLEAVLPRFGEALQGELEGLTNGLAARAEKRVASALASVEQKQMERLQVLYPDLDEKRFDELRKAWLRDVQTDTEDALADFQERMVTDLHVLAKTIETFGPSRYDDMDKATLERMYAHLWLQRIDAEITSDLPLEGNGKGGRDG